MLRGGAGRIIFTPYFLCANFLVILFLTVKYWSAFNYEIHLLNKVNLLEIELKSCKTNSISCANEFKHKSENLQTCQEDFQSLQKKYDELIENFKAKSKDFDRLQKSNEENKNNMDEESQKCVEDLEECRMQEEKCNSNLKSNEEALLEVRSALEECNSKSSNLDKEGTNQTLVESLKGTINDLNAELVSFKGHVMDNKEESNSTKESLINGELPDVNPDAVIVRSKPVNAFSGMKFHTDEKGHPLPILPHGNPQAPRPGPRFSVVHPPPGSDIKNISFPKDTNLTESNSKKENPKLMQLKAPPKFGRERLRNAKAFFESEAKIKPKNLDAREAENIDYEGGDQDPNGAIEDIEKDGGDKMNSNVNNQVI